MEPRRYAVACVVREEYYKADRRSAHGAYSREPFCRSARDEYHYRAYEEYDHRTRDVLLHYDGAAHDYQYRSGDKYAVFELMYFIVIARYIKREEHDYGEFHYVGRLEGDYLEIDPSGSAVTA